MGSPGRESKICCKVDPIVGPTYGPVAASIELKENGGAEEICKMTEKCSALQSVSDQFSRMKNETFWVLWPFLKLLP
jgi:hypothetical protein